MRTTRFIIAAAVILGVVFLTRPMMASALVSEIAPDRGENGLTGLDSEDSEGRGALEKQILGATLRIEIEAWLTGTEMKDENGLQSYVQATGNGHGTIKDGRYLVTHNHFGVPLEALKSGLAYAYGAVTFFRADGEKLELQTAEHPFTIAEGGLESLVFDFGTVDGQGVFAASGLPSAVFRSWPEVDLRPGVEVAQVDWDGARSRVDWVEIDQIITGDGVPRMVLSGGLAPGASGGGVFWNGYHVANNWKTVETFSASGVSLALVSVGALNEPFTRRAFPGDRQPGTVR